MTHPTPRGVIFIIATVIFLGFAGSRADAEYPRIPPITEQQLADIKEKAGHGDIQAEMTLAFIYYKPDVPHYGQPTAVNTPRDNKKSLEYFKQAAESGDAKAQTYVGYFYDTGKGVDQDYKIALNWYQMAAAQGCGVAEDLIGRIYRDGHGVPKDYAQAAEYFKQGVYQHYNFISNYPVFNWDMMFNRQSSLLLGDLYFTGGPGLPQDYEKAFYWLHIGANPVFAQKGPPPVTNDFCCEKDSMNLHHEESLEIQKHLTPEQIKKIKQQIMDFKMPPPNNIQKQP